MKNLQQIKDEVAFPYGYTWNELLDDDLITDEMVTDVAQKYAEEAIKEAAERGKYAAHDKYVYEVERDILSLINELK